MSPISRRTTGSSNPKSRTISRTKRTTKKKKTLKPKVVEFRIPKTAAMDDPVVFKTVIGALANHDRRIIELEQKFEKIRTLRGKGSSNG